MVASCLKKIENEQHSQTTPLIDFLKRDNLTLYGDTLSEKISQVEQVPLSSFSQKTNSFVLFI